LDTLGAMWQATWHAGWQNQQEASQNGWRQEWQAARRHEQTEQGSEGPRVGQGVRESAEDMMEQPLPGPADRRLARVEQNVSEMRRMIDELRVQPAARQAGSSSASSSADHRLALVEHSVCELRRMIKELVTAQPAATQAAFFNNCPHGAPYLFTKWLNPSIENDLVFVEAEGETDILESALYRARDSERFCIPAAPMALEVIEKWGVGRFGVEIHKGGTNSYLRFGCRACGRATPQLFDAEQFKKIFDDVFKIDGRLATF
jgi:hypothetical protein